MTRTDSHGNFSFELGDQASSFAAGIGEADVDSIYNPGTSSRGSNIQRDWRECELMAQLPGFSSRPVDLSSRLSTFESADIGRLVLHRLGQVEGLTISATSAMAPKEAQKAFEKARDKLGKQKWDEAQPLLEKAVQIYPRYAVAWFDLGNVQLHKSDFEQARHSFEQSIAADLSTFSAHVIESKSVECWNTIAHFLRTGPIRTSSNFETSSPSSQISPLSG